MSTESPLDHARRAREARTDLLRRARETAPAVLPRGNSEAVVMALGDAFYDQRAYQDRLAGEVLALAEQQKTVSGDVRQVLEYVSAGRRYVDVTPYPDAQARRALGALGDGENA